MTKRRSAVSPTETTISAKVKAELVLDRMEFFLACSIIGL
jgi:hypothetical protein